VVNVHDLVGALNNFFYAISVARYCHLPAIPQ